MSRMTKITIFILLVIYLTSCYCCVLDYDTKCTESELSIQINWVGFPGTVYAEGFIGYENCSTPNMDPPRLESVVALTMPLSHCNTTVKKTKKEGYFIASNKVIVQLHPIIPAEDDCVLNVRCEYFSKLPDGFIKQDSNVSLPPQIETFLEIISGETLWGWRFAKHLEITEKNFVIIHARNGGRYNDIRIRKCFAHANHTISKYLIPDFLLDDNACHNDNLNFFKFDPVHSKGDIRDNAEIEYLRVNTLNEYVYVTCAFELCYRHCKYSCSGQIEIDKKPWCYVRTHKLKLSDTPFVVRDRNGIKSLRDISERLLEFKLNGTLLMKKTVNEPSEE